MQTSIAEIEVLLEQKRISLKDILHIRNELQVPFRSHPLGFIVCTLLVEGTRKFRLHYWPEVEETRQSSQIQIHDHLFDFKSWVMAGEVENVEYEVSNQGGDFAIYKTTYVNDFSILTKSEGHAKLTESRRSCYNKGSSYSLRAGVLHETVRVNNAPAFTVLLTNDVSVDYPRVFGPIDGEQQYIYQRKILDERAIAELVGQLD